MKRGWKGSIHIKKYYNIKITEDFIQHKQSVNNSIQKIEITALKKS